MKVLSGYIVTAQILILSKQRLVATYIGKPATPTDYKFWMEHKLLIFSNLKLL